MSIFDKNLHVVVAGSGNGESKYMSNLLQTKVDTLEHINRVRFYMNLIIQELIKRAENHDKTKLGPEELPIFAEVNGKLKESTYGSEEYNSFLKQLGPALEHHYRNNTHHPEFYPNGVNDMDLCDFVEMFCDWCAATERHNNGNIFKSIEQNRGRFKLDNQTCNFMVNTAKKIKPQG